MDREKIITELEKMITLLQNPVIPEEDLCLLIKNKIKIIKRNIKKKVINK